MKLLSDWAVLYSRWHDHGILASALRLQENPMRGQTHFVFRQLEYVPSAKKMEDRFRTVAVTVLRIDDMPQLLRSDDPSSTPDLEVFLEECRADTSVTPLAICNSVKEVPTVWLNLKLKQLERTPYDRDWRTKLNKTGAAPSDQLTLNGLTGPINSAEFD